jgi:hypothetical protein
MSPMPKNHEKRPIAMIIVPFLALHHTVNSYNYAVKKKNKA